MATGVSACQALFAALENPQLKEVFSIYGYESHLDDLLGTVSRIDAVFRDAETKLELSYEEQDWIDELKGAVFEANDLLGDFVILAEQKQCVQAGDCLFKKASHFFSRSKSPVSVAYKMSKGVKDIKKKLDAIATNNQQFSFKLDSVLIRKRRPETCSYVNEVDIIGREDDLNFIVDKLLDSNNQRDVSFITIVGMGGLGKTALAQLVYNDPRVTRAFPLRMWTCVADENQKELDVKEVLCKILGQYYDKGSSIEGLQSQLREQLQGKKYLLVFDDVWTERHGQWRDLVKYLITGQKGSWIIVTTRSQKTATIVGGPVHQLQSLSEETSWHLFERMAFASQQPTPPKDFIEIGRQIVDGCAQLPLAIKVAGNLLFGQDKSTWRSFQKNGLANMRESADAIMPILKLSFDQLDPPLKSCFSYCKLFPKDFEIQKEMLISLWVAQGYIVPLDASQSIEDAGEEYFSILLNRSFFKDIKKDKYGEIMSCKMHDLMHGLAQNVTGKEMYVTNTVGRILDKRVRHLSVVKGEYGEFSLGKTHIFSFLHVDYKDFKVSKVDKSYLESLLANCLKLKALDLSGFVFKSLPDSVSRLFQLRYLNLSGNTEMEVLPRSISELFNLQTLILRRCHTLKELPKDLSKLVNLRVLNIKNCSSLTSMPRGIGKLTCLHRLSDFIVGDEESNSSWKQWFDGMEDLKALNNLRGHLNIQIRWPKNAMSVAEVDSGIGEFYLVNKLHLIAISFDFKQEVGGRVDHEATRLMGQLRPHFNLKYLEVKKYPGLKFPDWVTHLPNLVELHLVDCSELEYLPSLGILPHLKVFKLKKLDKLLYVGEDSPSDSQLLSDCPFLETLELINLPKFKGWGRGVGDGHPHLLLNDSSSSSMSQLQLLPCFSQLKSLFIWNCPELTCIPPCSKVEDLKLANFNKRLQFLKNTQGDDSNPSMSISLPPLEAFQCLKSLEIWSNKEVESLGEFEEVFRSCSSSLRSLIIHNCSNLRSVVSGGLEHLIALEVLELRSCANLRLSEGEEQAKGEYSNGICLMPWPSNHFALRTLTLQGLPQLVNLPDWMQFLPALQSLSISFCNQLKSMPNWMPKLISLSQLTVSWCSKSLEKRCQREDYLNIQHIPSIQFRDCFY